MEEKGNFFHWSFWSKFLSILLHSFQIYWSCLRQHAIPKVTTRKKWEKKAYHTREQKCFFVCFCLVLGKTNKQNKNNSYPLINYIWLLKIFGHKQTNKQAHKLLFASLGFHSSLTTPFQRSLSCRGENENEANRPFTLWPVSQKENTFPKLL